MALFPFAACLFLLAAAPRGGGPDAEIRAERFLEHVRWLASDELEGRATGSSGQKAAARRIASAFRRSGLDPVGDGGGFFQAFEVDRPARLAAGPASALALRDGKEETALEVSKDWNPLPPSASAEASGEIVFVGYAIADPDLGYDDFAGADCKGKVALALRHTPEETRGDSRFEPARSRLGSFAAKARAAAAAGAVALLLVHDPLNHPDDALTGLFGGGGETAPIPVVQVRRAPVVEALRARGVDLLLEQRRIDEALAPRSRPIEGLGARVKVELRREGGGKVPTENVAALLRGSDPALSREVVVLGAHYDHVGRGGGLGEPRGGEIHNGADDNASGTAGLLCVAEALAAAPRPRRSVLFLAFSGEEVGLRGSEHYVGNPLFPLADTVAMVNLDMIGRLGEKGCEVGGVGTASSLEPLVAAANEGVGLSLAFTPAAPADSDHFPFHEKKVPVAFFFTGFHPDYHRPGDDWEKINAEGGALVSRLACRVVLSLAGEAPRPVYRQPPRPRPRREREREWRAPAAPSAFLGLTVEEEAGSLRVVEVADGSPAVSAGIRSGDLLADLEGTPLPSAEALREALGKRKPGDEVTLGVRRPEEVRIKVRLGERKE